MQYNFRFQLFYIAVTFEIMSRLLKVILVSNAMTQSLMLVIFVTIILVIMSSFTVIVVLCALSVTAYSPLEAKQSHNKTSKLKVQTVKSPKQQKPSEPKCTHSHILTKQ